MVVLSQFLAAAVILGFTIDVTCCFHFYYRPNRIFSPRDRGSIPLTRQSCDESGARTGSAFSTTSAKINNRSTTKKDVPTGSDGSIRVGSNISASTTSSGKVVLSDEKKSILEMLDIMSTNDDPEAREYDFEKVIKRDQLMAGSSYQMLKHELGSRGLDTSGDKPEMLVRLLLYALDPSIDYNAVLGYEPNLAYVNLSDSATSKDVKKISLPQRGSRRFRSDAPDMAVFNEFAASPAAASKTNSNSKIWATSRGSANITRGDSNYIERRDDDENDGDDETFDVEITPASVTVLDGLERKQVRFSTHKVVRNELLMEQQRSQQGSPFQVQSEPSFIRAYVTGPRGMLDSESESAKRTFRSFSMDQPIVATVMIPDAQHGWSAATSRILADELAFESQCVVVVPDIYPELPVANGSNNKTAAVDSYDWYKYHKSLILDNVISVIDYTRSEYIIQSRGGTGTVSLAGIGSGGSIALEAASDLCDISTYGLYKELLRRVPMVFDSLGDKNRERVSATSTSFVSTSTSTSSPKLCANDVATAMKEAQSIIDQYDINRATLKNIVLHGVGIDSNSSITDSVVAHAQFNGNVNISRMNRDGNGSSSSLSNGSVDDLRSSSSSTSTTSTSTSTSFNVMRNISASLELYHLKLYLRRLKQIGEEVSASQLIAPYPSISTNRLQDLLPRTVLALCPTVSTFDPQRVGQRLQVPVFIATAGRGCDSLSENNGTNGYERTVRNQKTTYEKATKRKRRTVANKKSISKTITTNITNSCSSSSSSSSSSTTSSSGSSSELDAYEELVKVFRQRQITSEEEAEAISATVTLRNFPNTMNKGGSAYNGDVLSETTTRLDGSTETVVEGDSTPEDYDCFAPVGGQTTGFRGRLLDYSVRVYDGVSASFIHGDDDVAYFNNHQYKQRHEGKSSQHRQCTLNINRNCRQETIFMSSMWLSAYSVPHREDLILGTGRASIASTLDEPPPLLRVSADEVPEWDNVPILRDIHHKE